jgi:hypothetical protein
MAIPETDWPAPADEVPSLSQERAKLAAAIERKAMLTAELADRRVDGARLQRAQISAFRSLEKAEQELQVAGRSARGIAADVLGARSDGVTVGSATDYLEAARREHARLQAAEKANDKEIEELERASSFARAGLNNALAAVLEPIEAALAVQRDALLGRVATIDAVLQVLRAAAGLPGTAANYSPPPSPDPAVLVAWRAAIAALENDAAAPLPLFPGLGDGG